MSALVRLVVGLGSNVGDRLATLRAAAERIERDVTRIEARSRVWETAAVGPPQPDYLNAAVLLRVSGAEEDLVGVMRALLAIERSLGRVRGVDDEPWGPRTIDLDMLWSDGARVDRAPELVLPHPRLSERAFAIVPLLEVAPDAPFAVPAGAADAVKPFPRDVRDASARTSAGW